jgi:hypothetical protein
MSIYLLQNKQIIETQKMSLEVGKAVHTFSQQTVVTRSLHLKMSQGGRKAFSFPEATPKNLTNTQLGELTLKP